MSFWDNFKLSFWYQRVDSLEIEVKWPFYQISEIFRNSPTVMLVSISQTPYEKLMKYNHFYSNNLDISGTLFKLRIKFEFNQTQCEEGARDIVLGSNWRIR